jgi:uncharacterized protein YbaP (TraB family)
MKGRRHTPEQIVRKLQEADRLVAAGASAAEVGKALEVSEATVARWRSQYGGMKAEDAKELRRLRDENGQPPALVSNMKSSAHLVGQLRLPPSRRHLAVPHSPSLG